MADIPNQAEVVIIGGGVMGASTAYHLARKGCRDVVLLEKDSFFGLGATGKCAGGIRYQFSTEINVRLSQLSLPMFERFESEIGQAIDLRWCGYLFLLTNEEDVEKFRHNVALQNSLGVPTEWLSVSDIKKIAPILIVDDVLAGTFHEGDGLADPSGVVNGYIAAARRFGVKAFTNLPVSGVEIKAGRVSSVLTSAGKINCEVVINAAGPWAAPVGQMAEIDLPVVPVRRQMLTTTPIKDVPETFPFVIDFGQSLYFHREGEGILTGMSNPAQEPGFDETVDLAWESIHMEAAIERMPVLAHAGRLSAWAGLYEVTPDAHPIIGPIPEIQGFYVITGFSGHGFMHGPGAGLLLAELILDGEASTLDISMLDFQRFAENRMIQEYNVI